MAKKITIERGTTKTVTLTISPIKLESGDVIYFTAKSKYDNDTTDSSASIKKDVTNLVEGQTLEFTLTASDTNVLPGSYVYDVVGNFVNNGRIPLLRGKMKVLPMATLRGIN